MINYIKLLLITVIVLILSACDRGLTERERECMELSGNAEHCIRSVNRQYAPRHDSYGPTEHVNYYGHPEYGQWDNGQYRFNDPNSHYASSTNSFLLGAGVGGLAAYAMSKQGSRDSWKSKNPSGWTERKQYTSKNGKSISKKEFDKRKSQSLKDKAKHKQNQSNKKPVTKSNKQTSGYSKPTYNKPKVNKFKTPPKTKRPIKKPVRTKKYSRPSKPKRRY